MVHIIPAPFKGEWIWSLLLHPMDRAGWPPSLNPQKAKGEAHNLSIGPCSHLQGSGDLAFKFPRYDPIPQSLLCLSVFISN